MLQVFVPGGNTRMDRAILRFHDADTKITLDKLGIISELVHKLSDASHATWFGLQTVVHV
ncbi:hypothetical protein BT93_I1126 [Corymbia citriodora subsp. variegata]|nr:hypothetical protein BT93_I1126 [Corymbia citriodora subsp. variegata]